MEREKSIGIMRVRMLGGFSITYEGAAVVFDRRSPAKFIQLFQLLMLHLREGIDKAELIDALYGKGGGENGDREDGKREQQSEQYNLQAPQTVEKGRHAGGCVHYCKEGEMPVE